MMISSGAGANARHAIGTGVVGGMLSAALLGVLLIPVCYVAVRRLMGDELDEPGHAAGTAGAAGGAVAAPAQQREQLACYQQKPPGVFPRATRFF